MIASHNGVQSMNDVPYNLDEADVKAIADSGGVVGVIFMPYWLDQANPGTRPRCDLEDDGGAPRARRRLVGPLAIGTDFDGFTDPPDDCKNASELPLIRELLEGKGVSGPDADAILGGNARRVLRAGWR